MKTHTLAILGTAALVILSACEKFSSDYNGSAISFKTGSPAFTKVAYGEDVGNYQMIDWTQGDKITIAAKYARAGSDYSVDGPSSYSYSIASVTQDKARHYSIGKLNTDANGLHWCPQYNGAELKKTSDEFWAYYSTEQVSGFTGGVDYDGTFSSSIPQTSSSEIPPILVAHTRPTSDASGKTISLYFNPAFTAFRVTLRNASGKNINLDSFGLSSQKDYLAGSFSASISGIDTDATVSVGSISGGSNSISGSASGTIANSDSTTFYMFALPQTYNDLKIACSYTPAGGSQVQKTMDISSHTFAACKQHRMRLTINESGEIDFEISKAIIVILANAFPDLFSYNWTDLVYKNGEKVPEEVIRQKVLEVEEVTIKNDYGETAPIYTASDMSVFRNLQKFSVEGTANTLHTIEIDGLPKFQEFSSSGLQSFHNLKISNCPLAETVVVDSRSLENIEFNNLNNLRTLKIKEEQANSNLKSLVINNCKDLVDVELGQVGALKTIDFSGCSKMQTLDIGLAYALETINLDGCTSLKNLSINLAQSLTKLNIDDCTDIESIVIKDAQKLTNIVIKDKMQLRTVNIDAPGAKTCEIADCPNLTDIVISSDQHLESLSLKNLPSGINSIKSFFTNKWGSDMLCGELQSLSISGCDGFTEITLDPTWKMQKMHFESCSNLSSVTIRNCYNSINATKVNCPKLNAYFVVNNGSTANNYFN